MRPAIVATILMLAASCPALAGIEAVAPEQRDHYAEAMDRLISRDQGVEPETAVDLDVQQDCLLTPSRQAA